MTDLLKRKPETLLGAVWSSLLWRGLDKLFALFKHVLIASAIGLSAELDVFYMATGILGVVVLSWSGIVDMLAVPELVRYDRAGDRARFQMLAGGLFTLCLLFSALLAAGVYGSWDLWAPHLAVGFSGERAELLRGAIPWLLPMVALYIPMRFLASLHRALRHFSLFYRSECAISLVILLCVLLFRDQPQVLLWSYSLGIFVAFVLLLGPALRCFRPWGNPGNPEVRVLLPLLPGLLVLSGVFYVFVLVRNQFVSLLPEGAVGAVGYAWALVMLPSVLMNVSGAFLTVYAEKRADERGADLNRLISMSIALMVPVSVVLFFYGQECVGLLLERGLFSRSNTETVGLALGLFSPAVLPIFLLGPLEQVFRAERRVGWMVGRFLFGLVLFAALAAWFTLQMGQGVAGIALATALSYWGMLLVALAGVARLGVPVYWGRHAIWLGVVLALALAVALAGREVMDGGGSYWYVLPQGAAVLMLTLLGAGLSPLAEGRLVRQLASRSFGRIFRPGRTGRGMSE